MWGGPCEASTVTPRSCTQHCPYIFVFSVRADCAADLQETVLKSWSIWIVVFTSTSTDPVCSSPHRVTNTCVHCLFSFLDELIFLRAPNAFFFHILSSQVKSRGIDRGKCDEMVSQLTNAAVELNKMNVQVSLQAYFVHVQTQHTLSHTHTYTHTHAHTPIHTHAHTHTNTDTHS